VPIPPLVLGRVPSLDEVDLGQPRPGPAPRRLDRPGQHESLAQPVLVDERPTDVRVRRLRGEVLFRVAEESVPLGVPCQHAVREGVGHQVETRNRREPGRAKGGRRAPTGLSIAGDQPTYTPSGGAVSNGRIVWSGNGAGVLKLRSRTVAGAPGPDPTTR